tara:strand:+ start:71 stop:649 length:579 start_codon:yes stop_codon:yes gene_type:complete
MKIIKDYYLIKVEKTHEDTVIVDGKELYMDTSYSDMEYARQYGTVLEVPNSLSFGMKLDIKKGDKVYCHHFLISEENRLKYHEEDNVFKIRWDQIYCRVRKGKLKMLHHWNFVEQKKESKESYVTTSGIYIKPEREDEESYGYIEYMNKEMKSYGVEKGDEVIFSENSEYKMEIEGRKLLRMRNLDILAKID